MATLFLIHISETHDTQASTSSPSQHLTSAYDPALERRAAADNAISFPPEIDGTGAFVDWDAEASRVAKDAARGMGEEKQFRSLDQRPAGMGPLTTKPRHELGDSEHFEGGVVITWINDRCYYSNQDAPIPAFGPALRLQLPICKGRSGDSLPSIEDWKKERESR